MLSQKRFASSAEIPAQPRKFFGHHLSPLRGLLPIAKHWNSIHQAIEEVQLMREFMNHKVVSVSLTEPAERKIR